MGVVDDDTVDGGLLSPGIAVTEGEAWPVGLPAPAAGDDVATDQLPRLHNNTHYDAIADQAAAGARTSELAASFGYSKEEMSKLLGRPHMRARVAAAREDIQTAIGRSVAKVILQLDRMTDRELALALPEDYAAVCAQVAGLKFTDRQSIEARRGLMDRVMPKVPVVQPAAEAAKDEALAQLYASVGPMIKQLAEGASRRIRDIETSPHLHEGKDAVPRAIELGEVEQ